MGDIRGIMDIISIIVMMIWGITVYISFYKILMMLATRHWNIIKEIKIYSKDKNWKRKVRNIIFKSLIGNITVSICIYFIYIGIIIGFDL